MAMSEEPRVAADYVPGCGLIKVCGPGAFIVLKALAFDKRGKPKDAYDLYYVLRNHKKGVKGIGATIRDLGERVEVSEAESILGRDFRAMDSLGPVRVGEFLGAADEALQADVAGYVRELLDEINA